MGRKNDRVRRRNSRAKQFDKGLPKAPHIPRVPLDQLVLPDGKCLLNRRKPKARFATKDKAEKALFQAQQQRARTGSAHVEKRVYRCPEGGCEGWHLTSREEYDDKAAKRRPKQQGESQ